MSPIFVATLLYADINHSLLLSTSIKLFPYVLVHVCLRSSLDVDNDGYLNEQDVLEIIQLLCGELSEIDGLSASQMKEFAFHVLKEADLDGDQRLSPLEFEHLTSRIPDFFSMFKLTF